MMCNNLHVLLGCFLIVIYVVFRSMSMTYSSWCRTNQRYHNSELFSNTYYRTAVDLLHWKRIKSYSAIWGHITLFVSHCTYLNPVSRPEDRIGVKFSVSISEQSSLDNNHGSAYSYIVRQTNGKETSPNIYMISQKEHLSHCTSWNQFSPPLTFCSVCSVLPSASDVNCWVNSTGVSLASGISPSCTTHTNTLFLFVCHRWWHLLSPEVTMLRPSANCRPVNKLLIPLEYSTHFTLV